jgi:hypothetical protein
VAMKIKIGKNYILNPTETVTIIGKSEYNYTYKTPYGYYQMSKKDFLRKLYIRKGQVWENYQGNSVEVIEVTKDDHIHTKYYGITYKQSRETFLKAVKKLKFI